VPAGVGYSFKLVTEFKTLGLQDKVLGVPFLGTNVIRIPSAFDPPPNSQADASRLSSVGELISTKVRKIES